MNDETRIRIAGAVLTIAGTALLDASDLVFTSFALVFFGVTTCIYSVVHAPSNRGNR